MKTDSNRAIKNTVQWIGLLVIVVLFFILYYPVISYLVYNWTIDENYSHGFIIPFISAYLVWERRRFLHPSSSSSNYLGIGILLFGLFLLIIGDVGAELFTTRVSMLFVLSGLVIFLFGKRVFKPVSFPIAYLIFMIPLPKIVFNSVAFPLQLLATRLGTGIIQFFGIPVLREGNLIYLAFNTLEVTEACSGIRSLITMLALAVIFAHISLNRLWKKLILVLSAIPIAIASNALRIAGTGLLAHYVGIAAAQGFYHTFQGWFLFVISFISILIISMGLRKL